jgi:hypothetical protein
LIFGGFGSFLFFFDEPVLPDFDPDSPPVELVPPSEALPTGVKPSSAASCRRFALPELFASVSASDRPVRPGSPVPVPVSPGAGSAKVFLSFFSH